MGILGPKGHNHLLKVKFLLFIHLSSDTNELFTDYFLKFKSLMGIT